MKKNISLLLIAITLCVCSCSKDDDNNSDTNNTTGTTNTNVLFGKWNFRDYDQGTYTASWTFKNDGTLLINDKNDLLDGQSIEYKYNNDSKKLTAYGQVMQLVWVSSTKFTIKDSDGTTTYTKQ